ncbi:hypothetical protein UlMin_021484, partial [Ulmus minor]
TGKQRHIPYRDSKLTSLLQESLGRNSKLAMVCAISPTQSCKSETFSTLRFAQRAKAIKNKAIVNEVMHDDVNHLREVIQQDELRQVKGNDVHPVDSSEGHSATWIHRSLDLIKASLNCPISVHRVDEDGDEEMEIDEEAVEKLCIQAGEQSESSEAPVCKVEVGVQTSHEMQQEPAEEFIEDNEVNDCSNLQLVTVDASKSADKLKKQVPKAVEKVLAGAIRREMVLEDLCAKKTSEMVKLKHLVQQYKHERECDSIIAKTREDKILRLESLMDGILPTEDFMEEELVSLRHEHKLLKERYENHPKVLRTKIELKSAQKELENLRNYHEMGEREVLLEEIRDLRNQLHYYVDSSSLSRKRNPLHQSTYSCDRMVAPSHVTISESNEESAEDKLAQERMCWTEAESNWISLSEELRTEIEALRLQAEKRERELESEKKCVEELTETMQLAMEGYARMLEQYADLEEKHMALLGRHRRIHEGLGDVKRAVAKTKIVHKCFTTTQTHNPKLKEFFSPKKSFS